MESTKAVGHPVMIYTSISPLFLTLISDTTSHWLDVYG